MNRDDVSVDLLPTVVGDNRSRRIQRLREIDEGSREVDHPRIPGEMLNTPALIEGNPNRDGGVGDITAHHLEPLPYCALHRRRREGKCRRRLPPKDQSESVCPKQEPWILELLVKPRRVESQFLDELYLLTEGFRRGSRQVSIRPVSLLEDGAQVVGTVVEQE